MTLRHSLLLLLAGALCACGFELRAHRFDNLEGASFYVQSSGASTLATELKRQLMFADVPLTSTPADADYIIDINNEAFDRKVLSVSAQTGKVEEYEIFFRALLSVTGPEGKRLIESEPIIAQRDYAFDEISVTASFDQENTLRQDISEHAAATVLRRLQAVIPKI